MGKTELTQIADLLEGYDEHNRWDIVEAERVAGSEPFWRLVIKKVPPQPTEEPEAAEC